MSEWREAEKKAAEFLTYCQNNPDQRFWQALRNFTGWGFVYVSNRQVDAPDLFDTFYWESYGEKETP